MAQQYSRSDSLILKPEETLLKYVRENKIGEIGKLLKSDQTLIQHLYDHPYSKKTILHIACHDFAKTITSNTIDALIDHGADLYYCNNEWNGKEAIHFACLGLNPTIVQTLLKHLDKGKINAKANGNTPLSILIKEGNHDDQRFQECVSVLLQWGADIKIADKKNATPVYWAAKKGYLNIVRLLLAHDKFVNAKEEAILKTLNLDVEYQKSDDQIFEISYASLAALLRDKKEEEFISKLNRHIDDSNEESTFLQIACEKNLPSVVKHLLVMNYDPNRITQKTNESPLWISANNGFHEIFMQLIENTYTIVSADILPEVLMKLDYEVGSNSDYWKCYESLMTRKEIDTNFKDIRSNFPLHYAAKYGGPKVVSDLLHRKASLANRNRYNVLTISDADYETLKDHFDNCIKAVPCDKSDKESMMIKFDFTTLIPSQSSTKIDVRNIDMANGGSYLVKSPPCLKPECDAVLFMSQSSDLKGLLKHPLIRSFLYVKWHRIRWIFYTNLLFYLIFCASLLLYAADYYSSTGVNKFLHFLLFLTTLLLMIRESFQILVSPRKYFTNFENYFEVSLIITVLLMLFWRDPSDSVKKQLCAIAFLLAAFEFLFLLGNYPQLSTNMVMLQTVSLNFFKFLSFYAVLILAFAFCFHTLFNNDQQSSSLAPQKMTNESATEDNDNRFFVNPIISIFKTIIMSTGEFEAGEIDFNRYPVISHIIFILFVLTIAVILINLLNGLAVNDTHEIKSEAELVAQISRAQYVAYTESMIFSDILPSCLKGNYLPSGFLKNQLKMKLLKPLANNVCIAGKYLEDGILTTLPNQSRRIIVGDNFQGCCKNVYMDKTTMKRARILIQEKQEKNRVEEENKRMHQMIEGIYSKLDLLLEQKCSKCLETL